MYKGSFGFFEKCFLMFFFFCGKKHPEKIGNMPWSVISLLSCAQFLVFEKSLKLKDDNACDL